MWASIKGFFAFPHTSQHTELLQAVRDLKQQLSALSASQTATHTAIQSLLAQQQRAGADVQSAQTSHTLIQGGGILSSAIQAASVQFAAASPAVPAARKPSTPHPNKANGAAQKPRPAASFAHPRATARPSHAVSARSVTFSAAVAPSRVESPSSAGSWKSAASLSRRARRRGTPAPASFKSQRDAAAPAADALDTSANSAPRSPGQSAGMPSPVRAPQFDTSAVVQAPVAPARAPHPLLAAGLGPGALLGARAQLKRAPRGAAAKPRVVQRRPAVGLAGIAAAAAAMAQRRATPAKPAAHAAEASVNASTWSSPGLGRPAVTPGAKLRLIAPSGPKAFPALAAGGVGAAAPKAAAAPAPTRRAAAPVGGVKRSWADIARVQQHTARPAARLPPPPLAPAPVAPAPAASTHTTAPQAAATASTPTIRGFGAADLLAAKRRLKGGSNAAPRAQSRDRAQSNPRTGAAPGGKSDLQSVLTAALARRFAHANPSPVQRAGKVARGSTEASPASSVASSWDGSDAENSPAQQRSKKVVTLASRPAAILHSSPLRHTVRANAATPLWRKPRPPPTAQGTSPKVAGVSLRPAQRVEALLSPVRVQGMQRRTVAARQVR